MESMVLVLGLLFYIADIPSFAVAQSSTTKGSTVAGTTTAPETITAAGITTFAEITTAPETTTAAATTTFAETTTTVPETTTAAETTTFAITTGGETTTFAETTTFVETTTAAETTTFAPTTTKVETTTAAATTTFAETTTATPTTTVPPTTTVHTAPQSTTASRGMAMRLAGGINRCVGRVEIFYEGQWGTVCDDSWDMPDAEVACRQIGCGTAISAYESAYFGQGQGPIILDDLSCRGDEDALWNCQHRGLYQHNCGHHEDAGVNCSGSDYPTVNCGGILTDPQGHIHKKFGVSLPSDSCVWYITVANNNRIHLSFNQFLKRTSESCQLTSVSIYDGTPQGSALIGSLCETNTRSFISSYNSISIVYSSYSGGQDLEFSATYYSFVSNNDNVTVSCHTNYMNARVSLGYLNSLGYSGSDIFLNDPHCRPITVSNWLEFHIPYQQCLTVKKVENDTISYSNTLATYSEDVIVTYKKKLSLSVKCRMYQDTVAEGMYVADDTVKNTVLQYGLYNTSLTFFKTSSFIEPVLSYPYHVQLNQHLFLQASLTTSESDMALYVDTCVASPDEYDFTGSVYFIIYKRCSRVRDYTIYPSPTSITVRFGFSAFSFLKKHSRVYIQCKMTVCLKGSQNPHCSQDCVPRRKRAAEPQHQDHKEVTVVVGPVEAWEEATDE